MLNSMQIKQYQKAILTNIFNSQFVYSQINEKCVLKKQALVIEKKKKKTYILFISFFNSKSKALRKKTKDFIKKYE